MSDSQPDPPSGAPFTKALLQRLFNSQFNEHTDNHDAERFGAAPELSLGEKVGIRFRRLLARLGLAQRKALNRIQWGKLDAWAPLLPGLEWFYAKLEDERARKLLVSLIAYRLMGPRAISLPTNNAEFWKMRRSAESIRDTNDTVSASFKDWDLQRFKLDKLGVPVDLYCRPNGVVTIFLMEQYACPQFGVEVKPGDVAIDAGSCWGDTALNFANRCGPDGKVVSFEFTPGNLTIFRKNLELNSSLAERITVIEKAVWDKAGETLEFKMHGPATSSTRPNQKGESIHIETETIDHLVESGLVDKIDFIKMDIEGAELNALKGAENVLRKFKPRLAISLYHQPQDFVEIPRFLDSLGLDYRFSIDHFTIHAGETVLFAW